MRCDTSPARGAPKRSVSDVLNECTVIIRANDHDSYRRLWMLWNAPLDFGIYYISDLVVAMMLLENFRLNSLCLKIFQQAHRSEAAIAAVVFEDQESNLSMILSCPDLEDFVRESSKKVMLRMGDGEMGKMSFARFRQTFEKLYTVVKKKQWCMDMIARKIGRSGGAPDGVARARAWVLNFLLARSENSCIGTLAIHLPGYRSVNRGLKLAKLSSTATFMAVDRFFVPMAPWTPSVHALYPPQIQEVVRLVETVVAQPEHYLHEMPYELLEGVYRATYR